MARDDWITTTQAAKLSGYHRNHIHRLIRMRQIKAQKFGPIWQVSQSSLRDYLRKTEKLGQKRGPKRED